VPCVAGEGASTTTPGVALRLGDRDALVLLLVLSALPMVLLAVLRLRYALPSGDEPHYLIISQAILEHHDLDVQRVYDSAGYVAFHPVPIEPHTSPGPSGRPLPLHGIGGPVLWLVPFAVAGRAGVMAFMIAVSLATVANVFGLARALGVGLGTSFGVGLAFAVGTPILTYSSMSFVEPIGALVCVWALRLLHQERLRGLDLLLVSAGLGVLPWVHGRFLLYLPLFLTFLLLRLRRDGAPRGQFVATVAPAALRVPPWRHTCLPCGTRRIPRPTSSMPALCRSSTTRFPRWRESRWITRPGSSRSSQSSSSSRPASC
jgi:hypothetical protein